MKKFLLAICTAMLCTVAALCAACGGGGAKQPEKLKDGIALTLTEGESKDIDLSEYISIDGGEYSYEATSSPQDIATVAVEGNIAKITAVSEGNATVTASAGEVTVDFSVTVNKKQPIIPVEVDKSALEAELALEVSEQGDYTEESYAAYVQKLEAAKAVNAKADATQTEVDTACGELKNARLALTERVPEAKADAEKTLEIVSGKSREITVSDYIDDKNLSQLTYEASSGNTLVTVSNISNGKFTVTAGETQDNIDVDINICVKYKGESKLTVTITLQVKSGPQPVVKDSHITYSVDIYTLENKNELTIDFTENVESNGVEGLVYSAELNGADIALDGNNCYAYPLTGSYGETATDAVFTVTVSYGEGKSVGYEYTLKITDTTAYRIVNGGFETGGLTGWTLSNQKLGAVSNETHYWKNDAENEAGYAFGLDGNYMFSAYADGEESASGTLTSSEFIIGGSGFITFMLGAAKNTDYVYVDVIEKTAGNILARFGNTLWQDRTNGAKSGCTLISYKADLSACLGKTAYIRISDYASKNYGLFFVDGFKTYYKEEPEGFNLAVALGSPENICNEIINASFETGDFTGWTVLTEGLTTGVCGDETWWAERGPYNKVGNFHVDGWKTGIEESAAWAIRSSEFVLGGSGYISVRMGGNAAAVKVYKSGGELIGVYNSTHFSDTNFPFVGEGEGKGSWADMRKYYIDLREYIGETLYVELHDTGSGAWAHAFFDDVVTYYKDIPDIDSGYDTVTAPVSKDEENNLVYGEVQLKWRLAVKAD